MKQVKEYFIHLMCWIKRTKKEEEEERDRYLPLVNGGTNVVHLVSPGNPIKGGAGGTSSDSVIESNLTVTITGDEACAYTPIPNTLPGSGNGCVVIHMFGGNQTEILDSSKTDK